LFLFVHFCTFLFVFASPSRKRRWQAGSDGVTHAAGILTEALEKEKPTVGKNIDFSGNFAEGPKVSRRAV
jgi:hypothetical protein